MRPCLDCGLPARGSRCAVCRRRWDQLRNLRPSRQAYRDPGYQATKRAILRGSPPCSLRIRCDGAPADTVDHVVPLARGGGNDWGNLQPACRACNSAKRDRTAGTPDDRPKGRT